jgi:hypothetical protein
MKKHRWAPILPKNADIMPVKTMRDIRVQMFCEGCGAYAPGRDYNWFTTREYEQLGISKDCEEQLVRNIQDS